MVTYRKTNFETSYKKARDWVKRKIGGARLEDQAKVDTNSKEFKRRVYKSLCQDVSEMWVGEYTVKMSCDDNWTFEENIRKPVHQGGLSLKTLCKQKFYEVEALGMAND